MNKEIRTLWRIVEKTHYKDGLPLLALADKLEERGKKDDATTAYALRWMAEREKRPNHNSTGVPYWGWYAPMTARQPDEIPELIHVCLLGGTFIYPSFRIAVRSLGKALRRCLQESLTENLRRNMGI